jgi:hypothetical protein
MALDEIQDVPPVRKHRQPEPLLREAEARVWIGKRARVLVIPSSAEGRGFRAWLPEEVLGLLCE